MIRRWSVLVPILGVVLSSAAADPELTAPDLNLGSVTEETELAPQAVHEFHEQATGNQVWADENDFNGLLLALDSLSSHGLDPDHYHRSELKRLRNDPLARDHLATDAWFSAAAHMVYGKLNPVTMEPDWTAAGRTADLPGTLRDALSNDTVATSLSSLAPKQWSYSILMSELKSVRSLIERPPEPLQSVNTRKSRRKRERQIAKRAEQIRALQSWLIQLELLSSTNITGEMDEATGGALMQFQKNAGLPASGNADSGTIDALDDRLRMQRDQLRVNLERWRWLPDELGRRHVRVNIAGFSVTTYEDGKAVRTHPAIVGKLYRKTPVFSDHIRYIVFNPWWETPPSLASTDQLDLFIRDPDAVRRMGFQVISRAGETVDPDTINWSRLSTAQFPYRLRQAPGEQNPLGRVKIMFPNAHNVYLHDTPHQGLFAQRQRAFSSGCVRTQYPIDLAEWLLAETAGWQRERIEQALEARREVRVDLTQKVPVHILYWTVTAESTGMVRYLDDIYERDAKVLSGLDEAAKLTGANATKLDH